MAASLQRLNAFDAAVVRLAMKQSKKSCTGVDPLFDHDDLIDTAELIDGLPFVRLEHVIDYKQVRASPKDLLHLEQYRIAAANEQR